MGPAGRVIGIDLNPAMIAVANERAQAEQVATWTEHRQSTADRLEFPAGYFDASRSERLFQHLIDPASALIEMVRVTRAGGKIVVLDTDWGTLSIDTPEVESERRLVRFLAEGALANGYAGRQLHRLFHQAGLEDISYETLSFATTNAMFARSVARLDEVELKALSAGVITPGELERWQAGMEKMNSEGTFFASLSMVLLVGNKPATLM